MNSWIRPQRLRPGDTVGVVSVSSPVPSSGHVERIRAGLEALGLDVRLFPHVGDRFGYLAGRDGSRLMDLNAALVDPDIRAIFFAWGGKGANHLLPSINFEGFRQHPKIVIGLSDPTCIINALSARTHVITFHGPTGVNFAHEDGLHAFTKNAMVRALFEAKPLGPLPRYSKWEVLRPGRASGRLFGGHLSTVQTLLGTPYEPDWSGSIFFWEEIGKIPSAIDLSLTHFRLHGVLDKITGMIIGRPLNCNDATTDSELDLRQMVLEICANYEFPILFNVDLGHADPKLTIPIGALAELDLTSQEPSFSIQESGVV